MSDYINKIFNKDCRSMLEEIPPESVHLTVTSPPYFVGKDYDLDGVYEEFLGLLYDTFEAVSKVTVPGGKVIINLGDLVPGSKVNGGFPEERLSLAYLNEFLRGGAPNRKLDESLHLYLYARAVWVKDSPWANSNHVTYHDKVNLTESRLLPSWEPVYIYRKGRTGRTDREDLSIAAAVKKYNNNPNLILTDKIWKQLATGVWEVRSVARNDMHPAMYPEELVRRCILMYSLPGDTVLDPFMGSGTTAKVARDMQRNYVGYELDPNHYKTCVERLSQTALF